MVVRFVDIGRIDDHHCLRHSFHNTIAKIKWIKEQVVIYNTLHSKLKIVKHELHNKRRCTQML